MEPVATATVVISTAQCAIFWPLEPRLEPFVGGKEDLTGDDIGVLQECFPFVSDAKYPMIIKHGELENQSCIDDIFQGIFGGFQYPFLITRRKMMMFAFLLPSANDHSAHFLYNAIVGMLSLGITRVDGLVILNMCSVLKHWDEITLTHSFQLTTTKR